MDKSLGTEELETKNSTDAWKESAWFSAQAQPSAYDLENVECPQLISTKITQFKQQRSSRIWNT